MRYIFPIILGIVAISILVSLGNWQLRRLEEKQSNLAEIEARVAAAPVAVPIVPNPDEDRYLSVTAEGVLGAEDFRVLASSKKVGALYRIVTTLTTEDGRKLLVDLGYRRIDQAAVERGEQAVRVVGNLHWPDEKDSYTPDTDGDLWFARDVPAMAKAFGAEPVLIVVRAITPDLPGITALPVSTDGIPNNHLGYALTWYGFALVWLGMTVLLLLRIKRGTI